MFFCVVLLFCCVFCFYFIKISKFALPGVMLIYERTSKDRKKERKKEFFSAMAESLKKLKTSNVFSSFIVF